MTSRADLAESNTAAWETAYRALEQGRLGAGARIDELEAAAATQSQLVASLRQQLAEAQEASARAAPPAAASASATPQPDWLAAAAATAAAVVGELRSGSFSTLGGVAVRAHDAVATRAAAAAAASRDFVSREVEARAPGLQAAALLRLAEVQSLLRECHLGTLPVWRTAAVQCLAVEGEIKRMLLSAFAKVPALQGLSDPVSVQLATYAVIALPLALLLLPLLGCLGSKGRAASARPSPAPGSGKAKKGKSKPSSSKQ
ncbi:MAG: hypothetical protein WDW36_008805 [Sanguina aurantia]